MFKERAFQFFTHFLFYKLQPLFIYKITFIQYNNTFFNSQ